MSREVVKKVEEHVEITCNICNTNLKEEDNFEEIKGWDMIFCEVCWANIPEWVKRNLPEILTAIVNRGRGIKICDLASLDRDKVYVVFGGREDNPMFFSCDTVEEARGRILELETGEEGGESYFQEIIIEGKGYRNIKYTLKIRGYDSPEFD